MSNAIFPELRGLAWDVTKTPEFYTISKTSSTGLDVSAVLSAYPRWHFSLSYEFLRDDGSADGDLQQLAGFFLNRYGNAEDFLYLDPSDHTATDQVIGIGDGIMTKYQLCRTFGGFVEPIFGTPTMPTVTVNHIENTNFTLDNDGLITFSTPPPAGFVIRWSGSFYYRVKFKESMLEFTNVMHRLWEAKTIEFVSVKRVINK